MSQFPEEYHLDTDQLLVNFPKIRTELARLSAAVALKQLLDGVGDNEREAQL